jgi:hypothetical protein
MVSESNQRLDLWNLFGELIRSCYSHRRGFLDPWIFEETSLELAKEIRLANPGPKDKNWPLQEGLALRSGAFKEIAMERAIAICLAEPGPEDEGWTRADDG